MGIAIPYLQKLQKEGESGRKKITSDYTLVNHLNYIGSRTWYITAFTIFLHNFLQSCVCYSKSNNFCCVIGMIILTTGCIFAMWLGEKITDKGIGNGISLLIMVGIIATLPQSFCTKLLKLKSCWRRWRNDDY